MVKTSLIEDRGESFIDVPTTPTIEPMPSQRVNNNEPHDYTYAVDTATAA